MSLINCPECKKEVSNSAVSCPNCGFQITEDKDKKKKKDAGIGCLIFLIIIAIVTVYATFGTTESNSSEDSYKDNKYLAYSYAQEFVKQKLKSPSTAEFPAGFSAKEEHVLNLGDGEYLIKSWVDSQNSFGATIRTNFDCKIILDGENAKCEYLYFDE